MVYKACRGNTMAEYGLLLALLAVACMGGLSLLGNAMSNLHNNISARLDNVTSEQQATAKQADKDSAFARAMAALGISDANQAEWKESADMLEMESGVDGTQMPHFRIPKTSSSDANSTGASGDMMLAYAQSIKVANQLLEAAAKTQDASLKQWYLDTALQTVKLAKNQAAFEYNRDTDNTELIAFAGTELSYKDAASSMKGWVAHLYGQQEALASLQGRVNAAELQIAKNLVYSVTDSTREQYQLSDPTISSRVVYDPQVWDVRREATKALTMGVGEGGMALSTSLMGSIDMVNRADVQP